MSVKIFKGLVVEEYRDFFVVLNKEHGFVKVKKLERFKEKGNEIAFFEHDLYEKKKVFSIFRPRLPVVAALACLFLMFGYFSQNYSTKAYAYVSIDIKNSMEFEVSEDMRVLDIIPKNQSGEQIVTLMNDWRGKPLESVIKEIILITKKKGYLSKNGDVLVASSVNNCKEEDIGEVVHKVSSVADKIEKSESVNITSFGVTNKMRKYAQQKSNLSFGRYAIAMHSDVLSNSIKYGEMKNLGEASISEVKFLGGDLDKGQNFIISHKSYEKWTKLKRKLNNQAVDIKGATVNSPITTTTELSQNSKPLIVKKEITEVGNTLLDTKKNDTNKNKPVEKSNNNKNKTVEITRVEKKKNLAENNEQDRNGKLSEGRDKPVPNITSEIKNSEKALKKQKLKSLPNKPVIENVKIVEKNKKKVAK